MSLLVVLPDQDFNELIKKTDTSGSVVLMPESLAKKYGLEDGDPRIDDYDSGGEPDLWVDVVTDEDHYIFAWLQEECNGSNTNLVRGK
ncbi:MAG: hypothetical protein IBX72_13705 [Nitrospirae bacterium]|nr:hypothetical protein [Nitrospirota bacterium]